MAFLEIKNIDKFYGEHQVLFDVSIDINKGEVITIIGDSGNGKTTLLRTLNALETIENGEVLLDGVKILPVEKWGQANPKFGMVFQSFNLFPQYTALENITLAMNLNLKGSKQEKKEAIENNKNIAIEILKDLGLEPHMDKYPCQLSGGQCQRVAIARALALKPEVLCFDEPTSALDPRLTKDVANTIKKLKDEGLTIIIVTHDMDFCKMASDTVYFMSGGKIVESGNPNDIFNNPQTNELKSFIGHQSEIVEEL